MSTKDKIFVDDDVSPDDRAGGMKNPKRLNLRELELLLPLLCDEGRAPELMNAVKEVCFAMEKLERVIEEQEHSEELDHVIHRNLNQHRMAILAGPKKRETKKERQFTLVQIVDYCKNCVSWEDAKTVVAMLNKLLRVGGTKEEADLVDSIEKEFRQRIYGNVTNVQGDLVNNKHVTHEVNGVAKGAMGISVNKEDVN